LTTVVIVVVNPTFDAAVLPHVPAKTVIILQEGLVRVAIDVHIIVFSGFNLLQCGIGFVQAQTSGLDQSLLLSTAFLPVAIGYARTSITGWLIENKCSKNLWAVLCSSRIVDP